MNKTTHLLGGAVVLGLTTQILPASGAELPSVLTTLTLPMAATCLFGSLFPDIDTPRSKLGHLIKPISTVIGATCGHRGVFHAPTFYMALLALIWLLGPPLAHPLVLGFGLGVTSHLILDMFNAQGIPALWPAKTRLSLATVKVGGATERILDLLLCCAIVGITMSQLSRF